MRLTAREFMSAENSCEKRQRNFHTADDVAAVLKLREHAQLCSAGARGSDADKQLSEDHTMDGHAWEGRCGRMPGPGTQ